jgi:CCR4-NOT transcription complex subunit 7/8
MFAEDSIELLKTSGIDFQKFDELGIDVHYFGELMMMSGLVLNEDVKWVSFHSSYDFGYLLKTLTCRELPLDEPGFMDLLHTYFPCIYDVKVLLFSILICILIFSSMFDYFQQLSIPKVNTFLINFYIAIF